MFVSQRAPVQETCEFKTMQTVTEEPLLRLSRNNDNVYLCIQVDSDRCMI